MYKASKGYIETLLESHPWRNGGFETLFNISVTITTMFESSVDKKRKALMRITHQGFLSIYTLEERSLFLQ